MLFREKYKSRVVMALAVMFPCVIVIAAQSTTFFSIGFNNPQNLEETVAGDSICTPVEEARAKLSFVLETKEMNYQKYQATVNEQADIIAHERQLTAQPYLDEATANLESLALKNDKEEQERLAAEAEVVKEQERLATEQREIDYRAEQKQLELRMCNEYPYNVPNEKKACRSEFRSYMDFRSVTDTSSAQYQLLNSQDCYTDAATGCRMLGDRYCIALGSGYTTTIGAKVNLVFEDGSVMRCVLGDAKADEHTDTESHQFHTGGMQNGIWYAADGSVAEFIVDKAVFFSLKDRTGNVNSVINHFDKIVKVVVL